MLRFLIDTQLPFTLVAKLKGMGFDAIHTTYFSQDYLLNDAAIRKIAVEQNRIIITKDTDFLEYYIVKGAPPKVFLIELGNIRNEELFIVFENNKSKILELFLEQNDDLVICQSDKLISF